MPTPTVINQWRYSDAMSRNLWDQNYQYENWINTSITACAAGGATSGTAVNILYSPNIQLEYAPIGTQTTLAPVLVSVSAGVSGLDVSMTQTDDVGVEFCPGILDTNHMAFQIASAAAFFYRLKFSIETVAGADGYVMGFRGIEPYQAVFTDYQDVAVLNVVGGEIFIETIVGGASPVITDTMQAWADGETHQLEVLVDNEGNVTYTIDNFPPLVTAAYEFTSGLSVVPFFTFTNNATLSGAVIWLEWESGFQS